MKKEDFSIQLISKFQSLVFETDSCIEWKASLDKGGYGKQSFRLFGEKTTQKAHRLSYLIFKGEIPDGILVCHICDNPKCINPKHLFLGTHQDNISDCVSKGWKADTTECFKKAVKEAAKLRISNSKLSDLDVEEIRNLSLKGFSQRKLASKFDISRSGIKAIIRNKIRKIA